MVSAVVDAVVADAEAVADAEVVPGLTGFLM
ncbi:hypothetical protein A2U01_0114807, partial [Trifolium medium]|nr:hypothetical protein [Trifolium medium]